MSALTIAASAAAQETPDERFGMLADVGGGVWVIDAAEGQVARCREGGARAPRVVDVGFGTASARPRDGAGSEPICTDWVTIAAPEPRVRPRVIGGAMASE